MVFIYNQLTKQKEELLDEEIFWYVCGPTVYDYSHLGHARTYLSVDIMRRLLSRYFNKKVTLIMNITNIDDKIIDRSREVNRPWFELVKQFEIEFFRDMQILNIDKPDIITRVNEYIPEIIQFIQTLISHGKAYALEGSIYFDIKKYMESGNTFHFRTYQEDDPQMDRTNKKKKIMKRSERDFSLWKGMKKNEIGWESPFGYGRPGWHIECSAMAINVLMELNGQGNMTIHSGGIDLSFPHHENEIIQSETYLNMKPWAKIFSHIGHLNIEGQKMSKSLKNFIKIRDFMRQHDANTLRMMTLMTKYNKPMDYNEKYVEYANNLVKRIENFLVHMQNIKRSEQKFTFDKENMQKINLLEGDINKYINDDFNTPMVVLTLIEMIEIVHMTESLYLKKYIEKIVRKWYELFGFIEKQNNDNTINGLDIIIKIRDDIRFMAKQNPILYKLSDKIRDQYLTGIKLQDAPSTCSPLFR